MNDAIPVMGRSLTRTAAAHPRDTHHLSWTSGRIRRSYSSLIAACALGVERGERGGGGVASGLLDVARAGDDRGDAGLVDDPAQRELRPA